jgi:sugar-specific transcriptional regulator TrmB
MASQFLGVKLATGMVVRCANRGSRAILGAMDVKVQLQKFGLSDKQADIYLLLIERGELRIKELVEATSIPRSSVYESLKGLQALGLIEKVVQDSFATIRPYPLDSVKHHIHEQMQELESLTGELDDLQSTLQARSGSMHHTTKVRYYEGRAGARQILWNTFKATEILYVYSEWGRGQYVGMEFYRKFVAESIRRRTHSTPSAPM